MKIKKDNEVTIFIEDSENVHSEYVTLLKNRINISKNHDVIKNNMLMLNTGKYIVDMVKGVCDKCGIQYSVSENSLIWKCPLCGCVCSNEDVICTNDDKYITIKIRSKH